MADNIKVEYELLMKKFNLPKFEEINNEFEISSIEHKDFLLREIKNKIFDKVDFFVHILSQIFQPDTNSLVEMNEYRFIEEDEKTELFNFYKKLMKLHRQLISLSIENNDNKNAEAIKEIFKDWPNIKLKMALLTKELSDSWLKSSDTKYNLDYMG